MEELATSVSNIAALNDRVGDVASHTVDQVVAITPDEWLFQNAGKINQGK
ncbi:hypothetical protein SDD30_17025 [Moorella naiadis]